MLLMTFNPYYDDELYYDKLYYDKLNENLANECFVCYEIILGNEKEPVQLDKQLSYIKNCSCSSYIHIKCLDEWYDKNRKCPICRQIITKNELKEYNVYFQYIMIIYVFYKKYINILFTTSKMITILFLINIFLNLTTIIFFQKKIYEDYLYQYPYNIHDHLYDFDSNNCAILLNISSDLLK